MCNYPVTLGIRRGMVDNYNLIHPSQIVLSQIVVGRLFYSTQVCFSLFVCDDSWHVVPSLTKEPLFIFESYFLYAFKQ